MIFFWGAPVPFDATGTDTLVRDSLPVNKRCFDGGKTRFVIPQSERFWKANTEYVKTSKEIFPGARLVATNSPFLGYFSGYPNKSFVEGQFDNHSNGCEHIKFTNLPLSLKTEKGEVVIVSCSQPVVWSEL